jgi:hypothetical protein
MKMATGRRAFPDGQGPPLVDAILNRAPVTPRAFNPRLSSELEPRQFYPKARDAALKALAIDERQPHLVLLNVEPPFPAFHDDARFHSIVRRIGIPSGR